MLSRVWAIFRRFWLEEEIPRWIGLSLVARTGDIYAGLYYPMIVAAVTLVIGSLLLPQTHGTRLWEETAAPEPARD